MTNDMPVPLTSSDSSKFFFYPATGSMILFPVDRAAMKWHLQKFSSNHSRVTIIKAINWYTNYFP